MIKLVSCDTLFEAEVIKGRLADCGIDSILTNQNMNQLYAQMVASFTTVDVLVRKEELERAQAILNEKSEIE